jgi:hypothetical protein
MPRKARALLPVIVLAIFLLVVTFAAGAVGETRTPGSGYFTASDGFACTIS